MKYYLDLLLRVLLCFMPIELFYLIFGPMSWFFVKWVLGMMGASFSGNMIFIQGLEFNFIDACVAGFAFYLFWLMILLTKGISWSNRALMFIGGSILLVAFNVVRVSFLVYVALVYGIGWFDLIHMAIWQYASGVYVFLIWLLFVKLFNIEGVPIVSDVKELWGRIKK